MYHERKENPIVLREVCQIGVDLLTALEELHSIGYLHNDIKPDNVLFGLND